ncbi:hypothetical protein M885DRAFT_532430 [Pelagophyceae sp. CCMP2097]|nr:hypothetical protein M885DRAFT_532430 [Pelagophyceae sp. CCMP2097]|mmetsp:Transcript_21000/g.71138  ORF Transcript_21000/g.71138 Transcript_21000/m.71138 type:complete len:568 (+) Transcript_21000:94-1797(+)
MSGKPGMKRILSQEYQSKYGAHGNKSWTSGSDAQMVRLVMSASTSNLITPFGDSGAALRRQKSILELTTSKQAADDLKRSVAAAEMQLKVTPLLMACIAIAAAASFLNGYHTSVMNTSETTALPGHTSLQWSLAVTALAVGGPLGSVLGGFMASDSSRGGRSGALVRTTLLYVAGAVALSAGEGLNSLSVVIAARLVLGVACGATTVVVPLYLGELAPPRLRGTFGTATQLAMVTGVLVADIVPVMPIPESLRGAGALFAIAGLVSFIALVAAFIVPLQASPRDIAASTATDAKAKLELLCSRLYGLSRADATTEAELMVFGAEAASDEMLCSPTGSDDSSEAAEARAHLTMCAYILHASQQLCGINAVFYYSTMFLEGVVANPANGTAIIGIVNVIATFAASMVMDRSKRVMMLAISLGGMLASAVVITLALKGFFEAEWVALAGVVGYVFSFELGLGPIPWMVVPEMFDPSRATKAQAGASQLNWCCNIVIGFVFPVLNAQLGAYAFVPFGCVILAAMVFVATTMPETHGKLPEDVLADVIRRRRSRKEPNFAYGAIPTSEMQMA